MTQTALTSYAVPIRELAGRWLASVAADGAVRSAGGDFACSPAGLWLALSAVAAGARGETADELRALLGTAGPEAAAAVTEAARALDGTDALAVATGVWTQVPVNAEFRAGLPDVGFGELDPANVSAIDDWVREATGGLIGKLPVRPDPDILLLLVNALALKARWEQEFDASDTSDRPFTDGFGAVHRVPTMSKNVPLADAWTAPGAHGGSAYVVELRCRTEGGGAPARVRFVLGAPGRAAEGVLPAAWAPPAQRRPVDADIVRFSLPRLALRTNLDVTEHLPALGVRMPLDDDADFSGMSPDPLKIGQVVQESVVDVAEKGVEAAAATAVMMAPAGAAFRPRRVVHIAFDHPFGVVVLDGSGEVPLFTAWQSAAPRHPGGGTTTARLGA